MLEVLVLGRKNKRNKKELSKDERRSRYSRKKGSTKPRFSVKEFQQDDD